MQIKPFLAKITAGTATILTLGAGEVGAASAKKAYSLLEKEGIVIAEKYTPKADSFKTVASNIADMQMPNIPTTPPNSMTKLRSGQNSGGAVFKNPDATMGEYVAATDSGKIYLIGAECDPISATRKVSNYLPGVFNDGKDTVIKGDKVVYDKLNLDNMMPFKLDKNAPERLAEPFSVIKDAKHGLEVKAGLKSGSDPSGVDFSTIGVNTIYNSKSHELGKGFTGSYSIEGNYANIKTKTNGNGPKITEVSFQPANGIEDGNITPIILDKTTMGNINPENYTMPENFIIPTLKSVTPDKKEMTYNVFGINANGMVKTPNLLKSDSAEVKGFVNLNAQGNYITTQGKSLVSGETYSANNGDFAGGVYSGFTGKVGDANKEAHATGFGGVKIEKMTDIKENVGTQNAVVYGGEVGGSYIKDLNGHKVTLSGKTSNVQVNAPEYTVNSLLARGDASVQKGNHTISGFTQYDNTTTNLPVGKHAESNLTYGGGYDYRINKNTNAGVNCSTTGQDVSCTSNFNLKF